MVLRRLRKDRPIPAMGRDERAALASVVDAPDPDGPWTDIEDFALSYTPATDHAELQTRASRARRRWARYGELPDDPAELRACLFFEQRRWNLFGGEPVGWARAYAAALVRAIATPKARQPGEGTRPTDDCDGGIDGHVAEAG